MQICFRCNDVTNALLEKCAHAYGISKNQLLNTIVQGYLEQNPSLSRTHSTAKTKNELLLERRQANEILTRLLAEANDFYSVFYLPDSAKLHNPYRSFSNAVYIFPASFPRFCIYRLQVQSS